MTLTPQQLLRLNDIVGRKIVDNPQTSEEISKSDIARMVEQDGFATHRIVGPNSVVTMDFRMDRVNINVDDNSVILSVGTG